MQSRCSFTRMNDTERAAIGFVASVAANANVNRTASVTVEDVLSMATKSVLINAAGMPRGKEQRMSKRGERETWYQATANEEHDAWRCRAETSTGQCPQRAVLNSRFCTYHGKVRDGLIDKFRPSPQKRAAQKRKQPRR
jgi:hypothetical protein